MERYEYALIKIEEVFAKVTLTFETRLQKMIKTEEKKNIEKHLEQERKKAEKRAALIAEGKKVPDDLKKKKSSKEPKVVNFVPAWLTDNYERSFELGMVCDLHNLKDVVQKYGEFLRDLKHGQNDALAYAAWDLVQHTEKVLSLLHIYRGHPEDAIKRANLLMSVSK